MKEKTKERLLVISPHTADWIWRCGGTVATYLKAGADVTVVCLTLGARGESGELWKHAGITTEEVKNIRREEVTNVAKKLGVSQLEVWDYDDCPLIAGPEILQRLNVKIREVRPTVIITHDQFDCTNFDHAVAYEIVSKALLMSLQRGIFSEGLDPIKNVQVYGMEPGFSEQSGFVPQVYIDITNVYDEKEAAMACVKSQPNTPIRHTYATLIRGKQAKVMPGGEKIKYAECFSARFPIIVEEKLP